MVCQWLNGYIDMDNMGCSIVMGGTPKWMVCKGKSHENGWWLGVPLYQYQYDATGLIYQ